MEVSTVMYMLASSSNYFFEAGFTQKSAKHNGYVSQFNTVPVSTAIGL